MPLLSVIYERADGVPVDYAALVVKLRISKTGGGYTEKTAALDSIEAGRFLFTWSEGDLLRGSHMGAVTVIDGAGRKLTTRDILFEVAAPIE